MKVLYVLKKDSFLNKLFRTLILYTTCFWISVPNATIKGYVKLNRKCSIKKVYYEILKFLEILPMP
jgi:hypothetical protein